jgi:thiol-disulfide isomerase/thioredoxin/uncharacterized membrane protein
MERPWAAGVAAVILVAGLGAASYLAAHHENQVYGDATLGLANCPQTELVNCDIVNTSAWSEIAGLPIAALAIPTYLLLLGLLAASRRAPESLAYAFSIGSLTVAYSVALFVISKTMVGYLCLWCMRLYAVNLSIPILTALAARRSPKTLIAATLHDLRIWPKPMRRAAAAFVALFALTVAGDLALRSHLRAVAAAERTRILREGGPTEPAVPPEPAQDGRPRSSLSGWLVPEASAAEPEPAKAPQPYRLGGPLRKLEAAPTGLKSAPFDLQARIGAGKPIALIFWAPGFAWSERTLAEMAAYLKNETPQIEVYAIAGLREGERDEEIQEAAALLDLPAGLPLLVDDAFKVTTALGAGDVPNVALFSAKGQLVVARIKDRGQLLITETGNRPADEIVRDVAKGVEVRQVPRMFPYYPSGRYLNHCAPPFVGKTFGTGARFEFKGRSPAGRPTLVMFWSSTCPHCRIDVPQLVKWVGAHPGAVDVVGVTIIKKDREGQASHRAVTDAYIKAMGIPWTIVEDEGGAISELYESVSTPTTAFVSPTGEVKDIWYYAHEEGFNAAMDAALKKTAAPGGTCGEVDRGPVPRLATSVVGEDGKRVELSSLLDRPGLVHFWATWCKPCVAELPSLVKFRDAIEKAGAGKVVLVSVEGEGDGERIRKFAKTLGLDLKSYRAPKGGLADHLDMGYRLPRTFIVGQAGVVLGERQGSQDWSDPAVAGGVRALLAARGNPKQ